MRSDATRVRFEAKDSRLSKYLSEIARHAYPLTTVCTLSMPPPHVPRVSTPALGAVAGGPDRSRAQDWRRYSYSQRAMMRDRELAAVEEVRIPCTRGTCPSPTAPEAEAVAATDAEATAATALVPPSVHSRPHAALDYDEAEGGAEAAVEAVEAEAAAAEAEAEEAEAVEANEAVQAAGVVATAEVKEAAVEALLVRRVHRGHARRHIFSAAQREEVFSEGEEGEDWEVVVKWEVEEEGEVGTAG